MRGWIGERGTVLLEFVLVGTTLMVLLLGGMEFGRALNVYIAFTNAAREGARYGTLPGVLPYQAECWAVRSAPGYASSNPDPCDDANGDGLADTLGPQEGTKCILRVDDVILTPGVTPQGDPMVTVQIIYAHGLFFVPVPGIAPGTDCLGRPSFTLQVSASMRVE